MIPHVIQHTRNWPEERPVTYVCPGMSRYLQPDPLSLLEAYERAIASLAARDPSQLYRKFWAEAAQHYTKYGYVPTPEQYISDSLRRSALRAEAARDKPWAGRRYPAEFIAGDLRGLGFGAFDELPLNAWTSVVRRGPEWHFVKDGRTVSVQGPVIIRVQDELDCYRQYRRPGRHY